MPDPHNWTNGGDRVLLVKCLNRDGTSFGGFAWPKSGPVSPKIWARDEYCNSGGLFGWPWGLAIGEGRNPDACSPWLVFSAKPENVILLEGGKCKAVPGENGDLPEVVYYGDMAGAMYLTSHGRVALIQSRSSGSASATGYRGSASATGKYAVAASLGLVGRSKASELGIIIVAWWDESSKRKRVRVGYVGEDGIEADTWYRVVFLSAVMRTQASAGFGVRDSTASMALLTQSRSARRVTMTFVVLQIK